MDAQEDCGIMPIVDTNPEIIVGDSDEYEINKYLQSLSYDNTSGTHTSNPDIISSEDGSNGESEIITVKNEEGEVIQPQDIELGQAKLGTGNLDAIALAAKRLRKANYMKDYRGRQKEKIQQEPLDEASQPTINFSFVQDYLTTHQMDLLELPDMIAVDTIFISDQLAKQKQILSLQSLVVPPVNVDTTFVSNQVAKQEEIQSPQPLVSISIDEPESDEMESPLITEDVGIVAKPDVINIASQTENPNPQRNREIQAGLKLANQKDIGIQCDCENDIFFEEIRTNARNASAGNTTNRTYENFLKFVEENTLICENTKRECTKCGEICSNTKQIHSHMAMHWGPSALCENCGEYLEHLRLLTLHQCGFEPQMKIGRQHNTIYEQCPLYACGLMLKTKDKLLKHLEKHMSLDDYQCLTIEKRGQHTTTARLNASRNSSTRNSFRCQICLIRSPSSSVFVRHRKKCLRRFIERLKVVKRKKRVEKNPIADN